jgi:4-hydroxy-tetrahydrodipicolinate synthase
MLRVASSLLSLHGFVSAVPTPFRGGEIDTDAFAAFCDWQIGDGCISVLSNVAPRACVRLQAEWDAGEMAAAQATFRSLEPLIRALFRESNPIPLKHALSLMGMMSDEVRLPLCAASAATRSVVAAALAQHRGVAAFFAEDPTVFGAYL